MSLEKFLNDGRRTLIPILNEEQYNELDRNIKPCYRFKVIKQVGDDLFTDYCVDSKWATKVYESYKDSCKTRMEENV